MSLPWNNYHVLLSYVAAVSRDSGQVSIGILCCFHGKGRPHFLATIDTFVLVFLLRLLLLYVTAVGIDYTGLDLTGRVLLVGVAFLFDRKCAHCHRYPCPPATWLAIVDMASSPTRCEQESTKTKESLRWLYSYVREIEHCKEVKF
jgi:hypothetical protein